LESLFPEATRGGREEGGSCNLYRYYLTEILLTQFVRLLAHSRPRIGRRRIGHTETENLSRLLPLPPGKLVNGLCHAYGTGCGTVGFTAATEPAFMRIEYNGRFTLYWIGYENVLTAGVQTAIATVTQFFIKFARPVCRRLRRDYIYFLIICHNNTSYIF
jgi:hypothetical protein